MGDNRVLDNHILHFKRLIFSKDLQMLLSNYSQGMSDINYRKKYCCHFWENEEENAIKHVLTNSSWQILTWKFTRDEINSRQPESPGPGLVLMASLFDVLRTFVHKVRK